MEQETGIAALYAEFSRGYGATFALFCRDFPSNSSYNHASTRCGKPGLSHPGGIDAGPGGSGPPDWVVRRMRGATVWASSASRPGWMMLAGTTP